jgi:hypothetical protein
MTTTWSNHALQRTRRSRSGCHRGVPRAGSLSLGRSAVPMLTVRIMLLSLHLHCQLVQAHRRGTSAGMKPSRFSALKEFFMVPPASLLRSGMRSYMSGLSRSAIPPATNPAGSSTPKLRTIMAAPAPNERVAEQGHRVELLRAVTLCAPLRSGTERATPPQSLMPSLFGDSRTLIRNDGLRPC